ncbi:amino acid ABC transporter permease [Clostridium grantii]|uniref:Amino acid ABC transporter membrane protein, PAAT family n=1 Tax=Clostridium grantii DSM 8605 TaxID=1121316 RepID=A0A1M5QZ57_9CLOT|nr:amino acid ABC transporter permease [Clostridium grantii]SHH18999.1 amino acid ABC transporter membrane protein, PAAT family [Clostridium grantii DSM 8605]
MSSFDIQYSINLFPLLFKYLHVTITMAVLSMFIALALSLLLALIRTYEIKGLYLLSKIYISFFRGTPLLVQLFLLYYGVPQIFPVFKSMNAYTAAIIGLSLNASAYMAEIIRGSILSVDKGQMEASLSVGMTSLQAMKKIVLPQAARTAIPSLANSFIDLLKGSSLAFTLGVAEIMAKAQMEAASSYKFFEAYLTVAIMYWLIVIVFGYFQKKIENKMNEAY